MRHLHPGQVRGNYDLSINDLGSGANWRRAKGQQIYSPLLLAFTQEIKDLEETSLSANQEKSKMKKMNWKVEGSGDSPTPVRGGPVNNDTLIVELGPMEIRTFLLRF